MTSRHVILDGLDHHGVLERGVGHLHPPGQPDAGVRNVAVARDLIRRIDDDDALALLREHARTLAQHRRLADAGPSQQADRLTAAQNVEQNVDRSVNRATDAASEPDDLSGTVADGADTMQGLFDAGPIIGAERRYARADVRDVFVTDRRFGQVVKVVFETRLGRPPQIEDDFNDLFDVVETDERLPNREGEDVQELGEFPTWGNGMNSDRQY